MGNQKKVIIKSKNEAIAIIAHEHGHLIAGNSVDFRILTQVVKKFPDLRKIIEGMFDVVIYIEGR